MSIQRARRLLIVCRTLQAAVCAIWITREWRTVEQMAPENMVSSELVAKRASSNSPGGTADLHNTVEVARVTAQRDLDPSQPISADETDLDGRAVLHRPQKRNQTPSNEVDVVQRHSLAQQHLLRDQLHLIVLQARERDFRLVAAGR